MEEGASWRLRRDVCLYCQYSLDQTAADWIAGKLASFEIGIDPSRVNR